MEPFYLEHPDGQAVERTIHHQLMRELWQPPSCLAGEETSPQTWLAEIAEEAMEMRILGRGRVRCEDRPRLQKGLSKL